MPSLLNRDLLPDNRCFGCGLHNPHGLRIEVSGDAPREGELRARFAPTPEMTGFPGITHGGAIYTALDCLSTWVAAVLGPNPGAAWILRSGSVTYHRPAREGEPLDLYGSIKEAAGSWEPLTVATRAVRSDGEVCVTAEFKVVPLPPEKLKSIAGLEEIPANWKAFLER